MESEYFIDMILKMLWGLVFVVGAVYAAWRKVKEKRKLNDLAMYAIVEAQKRKGKAGEKESVDN